MKLEKPIIVKNRLERDEDGKWPIVIPTYLQNMIAKQEYVTEIIITPVVDVVTEADKPVRTAILAPANGRIAGPDGKNTLMLNNLGRIPNANPGDVDLRPCSFIVWGKGSQRFRVFNARDTRSFMEEIVQFD